MAPQANDVFRTLRLMLPPLLFVSLISNLAVLVSPLFMMQVLDRVMPSGNLMTLALLLLIALAAVATNALLTYFRDLALSSAGSWASKSLSELQFSVPPRERGAFREDVATVAGFVGGAGATTALSIPWLPLFIGVLALIHPLFSIMAVAVGLILLGLRRVRDFLQKDPEVAAGAARDRAGALVQHIESHGGLSGMMGLGRNLAARHTAALSEIHRLNRLLSGPGEKADAVASFFQSGAQIGTLSLGAMLVVSGELTAGGMIAATIITAKTNSLFDGIGTHWPGIGRMRAACARISKASAQLPRVQPKIEDLSGRIRVDGLVVPRGAGMAPRVDRCSFTITAGECLAILGESGSGKTTLLNALCGLEHAPIGNVLYDETVLKTLDESTHHRVIGYLPQNATLLPGTLAENISRFTATPDDDKIVTAARMAGVHGLISSLPNAYATDMEHEGHLLSAGQRQRVALARALYETPKFLFLDEPNALLDMQGERQLADVIRRLKEAGTTVVMVIQRAGIIGLADTLAVMERGRITNFGPRSEVLAKIGGNNRRLRIPVSAGALQDLHDWVASQFVRDGDDAFRRHAILTAGELYAFAAQNGAAEGSELLCFEIKFLNDNACDMYLSAPAEDTEALAAKIEHVQKIIGQSGSTAASLEADEQALAFVIRAGATFAARTDDRGALYSVRIETPSLAARAA